ncbi:MAG: hypothetical protein ACR2QW_16890 [bacterium]
MNLNIPLPTFGSGWLIPKKLMWYGLAMIFIVLAVNAMRLARVETDRQEVRSLMLLIQTRRSEDFELLISRVKELSNTQPFNNAMAETRADAMAMTVYMSPDNQLNTGSEIKHQEILEQYRRALQITPKDSYLWSRYALFLDHVSLPGRSDQISHALSQAISLGSKDYNTVRLAGQLGIKRWPWLNCAERQQLVQVLEFAEELDDRILARWNTDLRLLRLKEYLQVQYQHYGFNLKWAQRQAARCGEN